MKPKRIESIKNWPELQFIREIQVFIGFANFYQRFIENFSTIARLFTLMFKTSPALNLPSSLKEVLLVYTSSIPTYS